MYHFINFNISDFILNDFTAMNSDNFGGVTLFAGVRVTPVRKPKKYFFI